MLVIIVLSDPKSVPLNNTEGGGYVTLYTPILPRDLRQWKQILSDMTNLPTSASSKIAWRYEMS